MKNENNSNKLNTQRGNEHNERMHEQQEGKSAPVSHEQGEQDLDQRLISTVNDHPGTTRGDRTKLGVTGSDLDGQVNDR